MAAKPKAPPLTADQVREIMLRYFYERNLNARSMRSKQAGAAVSISVLRADLKAGHGLSVQQVMGNLTYLLSQGWVAEKLVSKSFPTPKGGIVPSVTTYYIITAAGIDKIEGPSMFTRDRFDGIKIQATGQNIITIGDGNQVAAHFRDVGEALAQLGEAIKASPAISEAQKLDLVADINSMQESAGQKPAQQGGPAHALARRGERGQGGRPGRGCFKGCRPACALDPVG